MRYTSSTRAFCQHFLDNSQFRTAANVHVTMLLIAWKLDEKPVLLVGAGDVAETRVVKLLKANADLHIVATHATAEIRKLADEKKVKLDLRPFEFTDLSSEKWSMVLTAIDDRATSMQIAEKCRELGLPVNAADIPDSCDFYFGANVEKGPVRLLISTSGAAPSVAKKVRQTIEQSLDEEILTKATNNVGLLKKLVRERFSAMDPATVRLRMGFVTEYVESHSWEELAGLDEKQVHALVESLAIAQKIMNK